MQAKLLKMEESKNLANYAKDKKVCTNPGSGKQEYLEAIVNQIMFGK